MDDSDLNGFLFGLFVRSYIYQFLKNLKFKICNLKLILSRFEIA